MAGNGRCDGCRTGSPDALLTTRLDKWDGLWKPLTRFDYRLCETCRGLVEAVRAKAAQAVPPRPRLAPTLCDFCQGDVRHFSALIAVARLRAPGTRSEHQQRTAGWVFRTCIACLTTTRDRFYTQRARQGNAGAGRQYRVQVPEVVYSVGLNHRDSDALDAAFAVHVALAPEEMGALEAAEPGVVFVGFDDPAWTAEAIFSELPQNWRRATIPVVGFALAGNLRTLVSNGWGDGQLTRFITSPVKPIPAQVAAFAAMHRAPIRRMFCADGSCIEVRVRSGDVVPAVESTWLVRNLARAVDGVRLEDNGDIVIHMHGSHAQAEGARRRVGFAMANLGCRVETRWPASDLQAASGEGSAAAKAGAA